MERKLLLLRSGLLLSLALTLVGPIVGQDSRAPSTALASLVNAASAVTEFSIPTADSHPIRITAGPDGNLWFTEEYGHKIGRITPEGKIAEFQVPGQYPSPLGITPGPDGNLWFTDATDAIGRITPQGTVTMFPLPLPPDAHRINASVDDPREIVTGPDGNLWFTEFLGNKVGMITPQGAITEYPLPTENSGPFGITTGPDGKVYVAEEIADQIGQVTPPSEGHSFGYQSFHNWLNHVCDGPGQQLDDLSDEEQHQWFLFWATKIGQVCLAISDGVELLKKTVQIETVSDASGITVGPSNSALFITQSALDQISALTPDKTFTNWTITKFTGLTPGSYPVGITRGPDHNIWFTEYKGNRIGRLDLSKIPVAPTIPGSGTRTFPETGKAVTGIFLDYWNQHGGLAQQGFPISNLLTEVSPLDGKPYTVQYFERAVFEYHPENKAPNNILLSQLGTFQYKQKYPNGTPNQKPNISAGSVLFKETGHRIGGKFLAYWQQHGGLAQQGYPISEEFQEKNDLDGKIYTVQYFERAVFEMHPENKAPYDVLLSQLGTFRYKQLYP